MGETKSRLKNPPNVPFQKAKSLAMGRALGVQLMCPNSHRAVNAKPQELQNSGSSNWSSGFRSSPRLGVTLQQARGSAQVQDVCEQRGFLFYK